MKITVVGWGLGGIALLMAAGGVGAQPVAMQDDSSACSVGEALPTSVCAVHTDDRAAHDLSPTQWLFGHGLSSRAATNPIPIEDDDFWKKAFTLAQEALAKIASRLAAASQASLAQQDSAAVVGAYPKTTAGPTPMTERFLIDEWQQSEVAVADSVYHAALQRIAATFDSTERVGVHDPERTRILQQLNAMLIATNSTWADFRNQIAERADSALARHEASAPITTQPQ
jgi:hypothetical protein